MCSSRVGMRITQWQWLKSSLDNPNFSEPKSSATGADASPWRMNSAPCSSIAERMMQFAFAHRGGADHQAAVGDGFGHAAEDLRIQQHLRGANGGARTEVGGFPRSNQPKIPEAEVAHRTRRRADVQRIARAHQHDAQLIKPWPVRSAMQAAYPEEPHSDAVAIKDCSPRLAEDCGRILRANTTSPNLVAKDGAR